jgi:type II secretory pathway pseudopilin PulG
MKRETILRPAIAMIELIFALVIIGLSLLSAPLIMQTAVKSTHTALQQEAIAAAASEISVILTHYWDEAASSATLGYGIVATNGDAELSAIRRDLNTTYSSRRFNRLPNQATSPLDFGQELTESSADDLDDFNGLNPTPLTLYHTAEISDLSQNEGEYIDTTFTIQRTISYGDDTAAYSASFVQFHNPFTTLNTSSNIKLITVQLTNTNTLSTALNKQISLSAFSCNIGNTTPNIWMMP